MHIDDLDGRIKLVFVLLLGEARGTNSGNLRSLKKLVYKNPLV